MSTEDQEDFAAPELTFRKLQTFLDGYDALELLCQASMTYLFSPEGQFHSESDDSQIWARHIEFAAGYYASHGPTDHPKSRVTGGTLETFKDLLDSYYLSVDISRMRNHVSDKGTPFPVVSAQIHSMHVRGEAYPHQFRIYADELYGRHETWFLDKLGFTMSDAIKLAEGMTSALNSRYDSLRSSTRKEAHNIVRRDRSWADHGLTEEQANISATCDLFFGQAKIHYRFTLDDLMQASGVTKDRCRAALIRLSQNPPYRNSFFPNTFSDAENAPWDYNTLAERPLITDGEAYWLVVPHLFRQSLYYTFFFDLMADRHYKATFEADRGHYLEEKTAEYLRRIFPSSSVLLNPQYLDGEEFSDVLILYDGKILIVQCKSKTMTRPAFVGADEQTLKSDIQKAVKDAIEQGAKGRRFLEASPVVTLLSQGQQVQLDMTFTTEIQIIAVTYMPLHMMATRIREVESDLGMVHAAYPAWALSLGDLDVVTDICHSPARLLHYIRRRLALEKGDTRVHGDEMDLLGFYLSQGLWMEDEQFEGVNFVAVSGFSDGIDEYMFRRFDCSDVTTKPRVARPAGFDDLVNAVEVLRTFNRTDCALTLLDLSGTGSIEFINHFCATKAKTVADGQLHSFSMEGSTSQTGISFIAVARDIPQGFLYERTAGFGMIKKYASQNERWASYGWREGSVSEIDFAVWLAEPWQYNSELESVVAKLPSRLQS